MLLRDRRAQVRVRVHVVEDTRAVGLEILDAADVDAACLHDRLRLRDGFGGHFFERVEFDGGSRRSLASLATTWASQDAAGAIAWINRLPPGDQRTQLQSGVVSALAQQSPREAAAYATQITDPKARDESLRNVAWRWSTADPASAAAWIATIPEGNVREHAAERVVADWMGYDPAAAGSWLATLPSGATRDRAAQAYVSKLAQDNPAKAAAAIDLFSNPSQRNAAIQTTARQWLTTDRPAAEDWLAGTALPADQKAQLLAPAPTPKK